MRTIHTDEITKNIKEMCIEANLHLADDVVGAISNAKDQEESEIGKKILGQLQENMDIASSENIPICQDTGMAVVFIKIGQDVHIEGSCWWISVPCTSPARRWSAVWTRFTSRSTRTPFPTIPRSPS